MYVRESWETPSKEGGFTLAELMVFVGIMAILLIGIGSMIYSGVTSSSASYSLVNIAEGANEALNAMVRQIRVASSLDPSCTAGTLIFTGDVDGNGSEETVRFNVANGYLRRGSSEGTMIDWIPGVSSVSFTYWYFNPQTKRMETLTPGTANWVNNRTLVKRIDILLAMSLTKTGLTMSRNFTSSVNLRNQLR